MPAARSILSVCPCYPDSPTFFPLRKLHPSFYFFLAGSNSLVVGSASSISFTTSDFPNKKAIVSTLITELKIPTKIWSIGCCCLLVLDWVKQGMPHLRFFFSLVSAGTLLSPVVYRYFLFVCFSSRWGSGQMWQRKSNLRKGLFGVIVQGYSPHWQRHTCSPIRSQREMNADLRLAFPL